MGILKARTGIFCCFLMVSCIFNASSLWAVKSASIVICAETGKIHHEQNADAITPPASLTKMMTLYLTFKALREGKLTFNQKLPVSKHASLAAPCKLWLKPGSTITVHEAIMAMVTKSANDASIVIAEALGKGSETHFAALMTHQARRLGMSKTVFKNSHGLPNKPHSITTARDMATLSQSLYKHFPEYFKFFKEPKFAFKGQVHRNHNRLLGKIPGLDGIKTGFINASGFNLAASVVRGNRRIIAVVMGGESPQARDKKMVKLLEATYSNLKRKMRDLNSIEDLIYDATLSGAEATPIKPTLRQAVYREQCKPEVMKASYASMDDILDTLPEHQPIKKRILKKSPPKRAKALNTLTERHPTSKKVVKKSPSKQVKKIAKKSPAPVKSRVRTLERKRTLKTPTKVQKRQVKK